MNSAKSRAEFREEARNKIWCSGEGFSIPNDLLWAFAPDSVDVKSVIETLKMFRKRRRESGKTDEPDVGVLRAGLIVLQCWCERQRMSVKSVAHLPPLPSTSDLLLAKQLGVSIYASEGNFSSAEAPYLRDRLWEACAEFGWKDPKLTDVEKVRTPQEALDFIAEVEEWIEHQLSPQGQHTKPKGGADKLGGQSDTPKKSQKKSKLRKLNRHGKACADEFKAYVKRGDRQTIQYVVREYVADHKEQSETSLLRMLSDNSDQWKT